MMPSELRRAHEHAERLDHLASAVYAGIVAAVADCQRVAHAHGLPFPENVKDAETLVLQALVTYTTVRDRTRGT